MTERHETRDGDIDTRRTENCCQQRWQWCQWQPRRRRRRRRQVRGFANHAKDLYTKTRSYLIIDFSSSNIKKRNESNEEGREMMEAPFLGRSRSRWQHYCSVCCKRRSDRWMIGKTSVEWRQDQIATETKTETTGQSMAEWSGDMQRTMEREIDRETDTTKLARSSLSVSSSISMLSQLWLRLGLDTLVLPSSLLVQDACLYRL
mgnify:CR=1 FL=1